MKIIKEKIAINRFVSKIFDTYFKGLKLCVFDIETTGLNPIYSKLIISGFFFPHQSNEEGEVVQYFADSATDEREILLSTLEEFKNIDVIITYNGRSFDMNFFKARCKYHNISIDSLPYNLDLYIAIRKASNLKSILPNLKQKTIEKYLGLSDSRADKIDGGESVIMYQEYLMNKDEELEKKILLHNSCDVILLYRCLDIISQLDFHLAMNVMGLPYNNNLHIVNVELGKSFLKIKGALQMQDLEYSFFGDFNNNFSFDFNSGTRSFDISIPCFTEKNITFVDLQSIGLDPSLLHVGSNPLLDYLVIKNNGEMHHREINLLCINLISLSLEIIDFN